jgi:DNA-binding MarR family transcriptional regulator
VDASDADRAQAALRAVILAAEDFRQAAASHFGLGVTDAQAISYLATGDLGHSELAGRLKITTGAATALVDRLERAGLVQRHSDMHDRRRSAIRLTGAGLRLVAESCTWLNQAFADVPPEELLGTVELMESLTSRLRHQADLIRVRVPKPERGAEPGTEQRVSARRP